MRQFDPCCRPFSIFPLEIRKLLWVWQAGKQTRMSVPDPLLASISAVIPSLAKVKPASLRKVPSGGPVVGDVEHRLG
jgi:hypothetical protein